MFPEFFFFYYLIFIYFGDTGRVQAGERQRERETQNLKQAPGSKLSAQSPTWGSNPRTMRSWPEPKSVFNRWSHPGTPLSVSLCPFSKEVEAMCPVSFIHPYTCNTACAISPMVTIGGVWHFAHSFFRRTLHRCRLLWFPYKRFK